MLFLLLVPAWIICEWSYWASNFGGFEVYLARMIAVVAAVYLTAFIHSKRQAVFGILFGAGAIALVVAVGIVSDGWRSWFAHPRMPLTLEITAMVVMIAVNLIFFLYLVRPTVIERLR